MRRSLALLGVAFLPALHAAEPALPSFDSKSIGLPPLSLAEMRRGVFDSGANSFALTPPPGPKLPVAARATPRTSAMPVIEPNPAIHYSMIVKAPDTATDYKLRVHPPLVEPAK